MQSSYQIKIAAEAFAAGILARAGYDVFVSYGTDHSRGNLVVCKNKILREITVKGTAVPSWGLSGKYLKDLDYHKAANDWTTAHGPEMIFFFISFSEIPVGTLPECWIATAAEVCHHLKAQRAGHGSTSLFLYHKYRSGIGAGVTDQIPATWRFSIARIGSLFSPSKSRTGRGS